MTTRIWWVRHGPTHAKAAIGWTDLPADLSDTAALERLSAFLPDAPIVSSDLSRAITTADAIQAGRPRLPNNAALKEMHFGKWEGLDFSTIAKQDPKTSRAFWQNPGSTAPPDGESWDTLSDRIGAAIDEILQSKPSDIIVVAHFAVILTALSRASGMPAKSAFSFKIDNLSVTQIDYLHDADAWRVQRVNHLP